MDDFGERPPLGAGGDLLVCPLGGVLGNCRIVGGTEHDLLLPELSRTVERPSTPMTIAAVPNTINTAEATRPPIWNSLRISFSLVSLSPWTKLLQGVNCSVGTPTRKRQSWYRQRRTLKGTRLFARCV